MVRTPIRSLSRPSSPFDVDVAQNGLSWRTYIEPLLTRIDKKLYGSDTNLPSVTFGTLGYLKLEGYNARDSAENMCAFVDYVGARSWSEQTVDGSLGTLQIGSHWPSKLSLSISPSFNFTADEDLVIEPTKNMIERLKFDGKKTVQVFILDRDS